jgi:hypothetical protein
VFYLQSKAPRPIKCSVHVPEEEDEEKDEDFVPAVMIRWSNNNAFEPASKLAAQLYRYLFSAKDKAPRWLLNSDGK